MKLSSFAITPLVVASAAFARSSTHSRLHRRESHLTDVCAPLNTDLQFPDVRENGKPYVAGHLDATICLSQVEAFIKDSEVAQEAIKVVGEHNVETALITMIHSSGTDCSYPYHSVQSATSSSPCNFKCTDGFIPTPANHPTTCACPSHLTECGGQCGHFHPERCTKPSPPSRRKNEPISDPASAAASIPMIGDKGHRRSNSQAGVAHGDPLDTPLSSGKAITAAGIQSEPEGIVGGLIHNSKLNAPGVGSLTTSMKAGFQVNHRSVPVPSNIPSKSPEGLVGKVNPESTIRQFSQGAQVFSRGVAPVTLSHGAGTEGEDIPRGGSPNFST